MQATRPDVPYRNKAVSMNNKLNSGWDTHTTSWKSGQSKDCSQKFSNVASEFWSLRQLTTTDMA